MARTEWLAGADYVGWEDKIHGGILATLLDEVMAWAPSSYDSWAVTAEMHLRYPELQLRSSEVRPRSSEMQRHRTDTSGERTLPACWFRRPAGTDFHIA